MPLPLIVPIALGGGWLFKKGAEAFADHVRSKAHGEEREAIEYLTLKEAEYTQLRRQYLTRLKSYAQIVKAMTGDGPVELGEIPSGLPECLQQTWRDIRCEDGVFANFERTSFLAMSQGEQRKFYQGANYIARHNPGAAPAVAAAVAVQSLAAGAEDIVNANKNLSAAQTQAKIVKAEADKLLSNLRNQYEQLSLGWDLVVIPRISKANSEPKDQEALTELRSFAVIAEEKALKLLREFSDAE